MSDEDADDVGLNRFHQKEFPVVCSIGVSISVIIKLQGASIV